VLAAITESWIRDWMDDSDGFPGRRRNVLAAVSSVRRIFHAEDKVYSSLITANKSSTATLVSCEVSGVASFRGLLDGVCINGIDGLLGIDKDWRAGDS
jgi:hypothetical protein